MRLEVRRLREFFATSVKRADVRPITGMDSHVCAKIEIQTEPLAATLEGTLKRFLACVHQLMPLEFGALDERLATLGTHVHPRPVSVQMLAHRAIVPEHFRAALVRTGDGTFHAVHHRWLAHFQLVAGSRELGQLLRIRQI